jgi:hypothetical protein
LIIDITLEGYQLTFEATDFEARSDVARSDSDVAYHVKVQATFIQRVSKSSESMSPTVTSVVRSITLAVFSGVEI